MAGRKKNNGWKKLLSNGAHVHADSLENRIRGFRVKTAAEGKKVRALMVKMEAA